MQKASLLQQPDQLLSELASDISKQADQNESVFCAPLEGYPPTAVIWLSLIAERNIAIAEREEDICNYMVNMPKQYVFYIVENNTFSTKKGKCAGKGQ